MVPDILRKRWIDDDHHAFHCVVIEIEQAVEHGGYRDVNQYLGHVCAKTRPESGGRNDEQSGHVSNQREECTDFEGVGSDTGEMVPASGTTGREDAMRRHAMVASACRPSSGLVRRTRPGEI